MENDSTEVHARLVEVWQGTALIDPGTSDNPMPSYEPRSCRVKIADHYPGRTPPDATAIVDGPPVALGNQEDARADILVTACAALYARAEKAERERDEARTALARVREAARKYIEANRPGREIDIISAYTEFCEAVR